MNIKPLVNDLTKAGLDVMKISYVFSGPKSNASLQEQTAAVEYLRNIWEDIDLCESMYLVLLTRQYKVKGYLRIGVGNVHGVIANISMIYAACLLTNTSNYFVAHNHPSGDIQPSEADIRLTKKLSNLNSEFGEIKCIDHLIIAKNDYYSFMNEGYIKI